jgi:hypothetical protein
MDVQVIFNIILGLAAFFGSFALYRIVKSIDDLDDDVREMPKTYVTKDDYRRDIDDIKEMLSKIFDRLENKADK